MTGHPTTFDIEAWHAGEDRPGVAEHVAECLVCRAYAAELDAARAAFHASAQPEAWTRRIRRRVERRSQVRRRGLLTAIGGGLAAALALVTVWPTAPRAPEARFEAAPGDRLKASLPGLAIIRLRGGAQTRHAIGAEIMAGDRLRVELTVPHPGELEIGVLPDSGAYVRLARRRYDAGVHIVEGALAVDGEITGGRLLAGSPIAVAAFVRGHGGALSVFPLQVAR